MTAHALAAIVASGHERPHPGRICPAALAARAIAAKSLRFGEIRIHQDRHRSAATLQFLPQAAKLAG
jgi:hypothetical protein